LQGVELDKRVLEICNLSGLGEALYGLYRRAVELGRQDQAASNNRAIHLHRAGPAHTMLATYVTTRQSQGVTQEIDEVRSGVHPLLNFMTVDF
jgi:hypothetical protein